MRTSYVKEIIQLEDMPKTFWVHKILDNINLTNTNTGDLNNLFKELYQQILSTPEIPNTFFSQRNYNYFIYETILDVYHFAHLSCIPQKSKNCNKTEQRKTYLKYIDSKTSVETFRVNLSNRKKELLNHIQELSIPINRISYSTKTLEYYDLIAFYLTEDNNHLDTFSLTFNIRNYPHFIYNNSHYYSGIQYYNFLKMQKEFLKSHPQETTIVTFDNEYACYINEKLHHTIQFQKCMNAFCNQKYDTVSINERLFPLWTFTKLYDTNYLSLTNYMESSYKTELSLLYNTDIKSEHIISKIFIELQSYSTYILPLLNLLIKKIFFTIYNGNYERIALASKKYITEYLKCDTNNNSYYRTNEFNLSSADKIYYPFGNTTLSTSLENTNCIESSFNKIFSKYFYTKDFVNYLNIAICYPNNISLSNCYQCIADYYFLSQQNQSNYSIQENVLLQRIYEEKMGI